MIQGELIALQLVLGRIWISLRAVNFTWHSKLCFWGMVLPSRGCQSAPKKNASLDWYFQVGDKGIGNSCFTCDWLLVRFLHFPKFSFVTTVVSSRRCIFILDFNRMVSYEFLSLNVWTLPHTNANPFASSFVRNYNEQANPRDIFIRIIGEKIRHGASWRTLSMLFINPGPSKECHVAKLGCLNKHVVTIP